VDKLITYSLKSGEKRSDQYYLEVADFTDEVLDEARERVGATVLAFRTYLQESGREKPRSTAEYSFELLTLGVLWRVYAENALGLNRLSQRVLDKLVRWRRRYRFLKPGIDLIRGTLARSLLSRPMRRPDEVPALSMKKLDRLLAWLAAAGDFREEMKRLRNWRAFFSSREGNEVNEIMSRVTSLAVWFESRSLETLGKYTPKVNQFLDESHPNYRWREDNVFCGRQRVEYHMNMVGTEIMNRAFRDSFLRTKRKVVLVPPCMTAKSSDECEAVDTPYGGRCMACTPGCRVHQMTKLGEKRGFDVFILPHELSVFSDGKVKPRENGAVGVVGVSCPLTNVTGGWETMDKGIPAQGVLLDYCGCPWHWDLDGGIPTDINFKQLLRVMEL
jgi:hypothetical protein